MARFAVAGVASVDLVNPWGPASGATAFDVVVTFEDHVAFYRYIGGLPAARRRLVNWAFAGCVAAPILAFIIVLIAKGALAGTGCDLDEALDPAGRLRVYLQATVGVAIAEALAGGAILALRPRVLKAGGRSLLRGRPGIDPADPTLSEPCRCTVDAEGVRSDTPGLDALMRWPAVRRFVETADHMFVVVGPRQAFIVPKRDVPPATVLAVRDLARAHVRPH